MAGWLSLCFCHGIGLNPLSSALVDQRMLSGWISGEIRV